MITVDHAQADWPSYLFLCIALAGADLWGGRYTHITQTIRIVALVTHDNAPHVFRRGVILGGAD
ncbi:hypothetical protein D2N39_20725 [Gemmobacter lutimaris]|uniref:Uncharacterized protein n=1 Tax=Gemmobacter lutimaris TaxID=2306023 RepID=A0A398BLQ0_9RHOB|nr:hypothetical protein D2N39_20725 [Gemmobacter lutimaris]